MNINVLIDSFKDNQDLHVFTMDELKEKCGEKSP